MPVAADDDGDLPLAYFAALNGVLHHGYALVVGWADPGQGDAELRTTQALEDLLQDGAGDFGGQRIVPDRTGAAMNDYRWLGIGHNFLKRSGVLTENPARTVEPRLELLARFVNSVL